MSAEKNTQKWMAASRSAASLGAMSPVEGIQRLADGNMGQASNMAEVAAMREAQIQAEKKRKSGLLGKLGSLIGGIAGTAIPGVGPILGPAIGSALGGTAGQATGGGGVNLGDTLSYGAQGAMGGLVSKGIGTMGKTNADLAAASGNAPALSANAATQGTSKAAPYMDYLKGYSLANGLGGVGYGDPYDPNSPAYLRYGR